jgi:hypothetical protein
MGNKYKTDTIVSVTEIEKLLIILNPCNKINLSSVFIEYSKMDQEVILFQC